MYDIRPSYPEFHNATGIIQSNIIHQHGMRNGVAKASLLRHGQRNPLALRRSTTRIPYRPQLDTDDIEFLALIAQGLVAKCEARAADTLFKRVVQPEAVMSIATSDAQETRLAEHHVVVHARIGECLEADAFWG